MGCTVGSASDRDRGAVASVTSGAATRRVPLGSEIWRKCITGAAEKTAS
jgi:hypothetical protein